MGLKHILSAKKLSHDPHHSYYYYYIFVALRLAGLNIDLHWMLR
jgi:hypothetical protein